MKKEGHKATSEPTAREKFKQRTKKDGSVEVDFSLTGQDFLDQKKSVNLNDKRDQSKPQNFGIIPGMSFGEAFAQAGKGGAKAGTNPDTFFWTNPDLVKNPEQISETFLYDFEKEKEEVKINPLTGASEGSEIIQGKYGKVSTRPL